MKITPEQQQKLINSLKLLIDLYNKNTPGVNYTDVRDFQITLEELGIDVSEI